MAQPDEVANYKTGDGIEKAFTLANILLSRNPEAELDLTVDGVDVVLKCQKEFSFTSTKNLTRQLRIKSDSCEVGNV